MLHNKQTNKQMSVKNKQTNASENITSSVNLLGGGKYWKRKSVKVQLRKAEPDVSYLWHLYIFLL